MASAAFFPTGKHGNQHMGGKNSGGRPNVARRIEAARLRAKGLTLEAIGGELGVSRQAVSSLLKRIQHPRVFPGMFCSACGKPLVREPRQFLHNNGLALCLVCLPADASLGQRLKSYRLAAGLTQEEMAERTGIDFQTLSAYERGNALPKWLNVEKLIKTLGVAFVDMGKHFLDRPVGDLFFSPMTDHLLARAGVRTIRQLRQRSAQTLESAGFAAIPLKELRAKLAEYGLSLAGE
jgi:transcriptional regulator with XRE-family HTH domain